MSFRPLNAQIELAFENAPVCLPVAEPACPGVPGGPAISPAKAGPPVKAPTASAQTKAANVLRIYFLPSPVAGIGDPSRYDANDSRVNAWRKHHCERLFRN
jgi:hypothetical protein